MRQPVRSKLMESSQKADTSWADIMSDNEEAEYGKRKELESSGDEEEDNQTSPSRKRREIGIS